MNKEDIFHDYNLVCQMKVSDNHKVRILTDLFAAQTNPWRVVGITGEALKIFAKYNFLYKSRMGIHRAHIKGRKNIYITMMHKEFTDYNDWWEFYFQNDRTVLATSSENRKEDYSIIYNVDESSGLFRNNGYCWRYTKEEKNFLEELNNDINSNVERETFNILS